MIYSLARLFRRLHQPEPLQDVVIELDAEQTVLQIKRRKGHRRRIQSTHCHASEFRRTAWLAVTAWRGHCQHWNAAKHNSHRLILSQTHHDRLAIQGRTSALSTGRTHLVLRMRIRPVTFDLSFVFNSFFFFLQLPSWKAFYSHDFRFYPAFKLHLISFYCTLTIYSRSSAYCDSVSVKRESSPYLI